MNLEKLFNELKKEYPNIKLPNIFDVEDYNESQVKINGEWTNYIYGCGTMCKSNKYVYVETDRERGYIADLREFDSEELLEQYIANLFSTIAKASNEDNSDEEMVIMFVQRKYNYSKKQARRMVTQIARHKEVFDEFFNYSLTNDLCKRDGSKVSIEGFTAERLMHEYNLSVLGAYNYLVYLSEEPERALKDLKNRLPRK